MSKKKGRKVVLGQFNTKKPFWLKKHIVDFVKGSKAKTVLDPFAGDGDLLRAIKGVINVSTTGLDIDKKLKWKHNDSLKTIPKIKNSIIITNPPYLSNYSAKRKGVYSKVKKYFEKTVHDDLYKIAIERCMESSDYGVMIVPETFVNSSFPKERIASITVIEDSMFEETDTPVCVICFDPIKKSLDKIEVYKNDKYIGRLGSLEKKRMNPKNVLGIKFNSLKGQVALRAVDTTKSIRLIEFMRPGNMNYDLTTIKVSSRLITLIEIKASTVHIDDIIRKSNSILVNYRKSTGDILLSPFKGNKEDGSRRRRLDYKTARAILEEAYKDVVMVYNRKK
jgi:hypothetical protein